MDPLSDILRSVRLSGAVLFRARATAPWGVQAPPPHMLLQKLRPDATHHRLVVFHVVTDGECVVRSDDDTLTLTTGDLILVTQTTGHVLADGPDSPTIPATEILPSFELGSAPPIVEIPGGGGAVSALTCGIFIFDQLGFNPLLSALPPLLRIRPNEGPPAPWLQASLDYVVSEAENQRPGSASSMSRLTELLFVEIVRAYLARLPEGNRGWLAGLRDPMTGRALELLHAEPGYDWTVETLAKHVGASRSTLATRFCETIGEPPRKYLARLRVHRAADHLRNGDDNIGAVAALLGYESEPAFNRAFKRIMGKTPGAWRRTQVSGQEHTGDK